MSVQAITWALEQTCATATEKAVLLVVANYVGPDGTTFVGQETISEQACCSIKTVERSLAAFEKAGWIERERRHRKDGSRTSDLIISKGPKHPERRENDQTDNKSGRRAPNRHPVQTKQTSCPNLPDTVSGPTSFEPLEEPLGEDAVAAREPANDPVPVAQVVETVVSDWPEGDARHHAELLSRAAKTIRLDPSRQPGLTTTLGRLAAWRRDGASWEHDVLPVVTTIAAKPGQPISSWKFFDAPIAQSIADNRQALNIPEARHAAPSDVRRTDRHVAVLDNYDRHWSGAEQGAELLAARRNL
ncbi:helix-turn-helix domain-containing protein [Brevundimonas sp.]|uniref:helix-turn-helix domain-containing protein n=1 Tax=Brevundimonas sp. TaxID=1871086 RepID=UPI002ED79C04